MSFTNEFRIHGNLIRDVQSGRTKGGVATAFYVVAVDQFNRSGDGTQASTDFIPITTYARQAENDLKFLAKGREVAIRGRIRSWYDGTKRRGGFIFEPDPGCVRYIGAPVSRSAEVLTEQEIDKWLRDYDAASHQFDDVPFTTRPPRTTARA